LVESRLGPLPRLRFETGVSLNYLMAF
jgi:hypothetical protein